MKPEGTAIASRERKRVIGLVGVVVIAALLGGVLVPWVEPLSHAEVRAQNRLIASVSDRIDVSDLVFVGIDEASLTLDALWPEDIAGSKELASMSESGWPWSREVFGRAVERLLEAGARVVVLDLIFDRERDGDAEFQRVLENHSDRVVMAANFDTGAIHAGAMAPSLTMPCESLVPDSSKQAVGYVNFWPDDGVIRSVVWQTPWWARVGLPPVRGATVYDSLAAVTLRLIGEEAKIPEGFDPTPILFPASDAVTVVPFYSLFLNADWTTRLEDGAVFKDKIVLIGPLAPRMQDFHATPVDSRLPGPLVHAAAIAAARSEMFYVNPGLYGKWISNLLVAVSVFIIVTTVRKPIRALVFTAALAIGWVVSVIVVFQFFLTLLPLIQPVSIVLFAGVGSLAWTYGIQRRESLRLRSTLDRYVSRNVVREILDTRDDFLTTLGGTRLPMTVLFSDVRGFTSYSEQADATAVVQQLNEYFGAMVEIVFKNSGTVDKFLGDGLMAVWGNVVSNGIENDAMLAVRAASEMRDRVAALNADWSKRGLPTFAIGIGLHHGDAVFGNIGSEAKMEPTVIGDPVNLASRVEGLTKRYHQSLCFTKAVADLVAGAFAIRTVDLVIPVGKSIATEIFTLAGTGALDEAKNFVKYENAVHRFRAADFEEAKCLFESFLADNPGDFLGQYYLDRTVALLANLPDSSWSPAVRLDQK